VHLDADGLAGLSSMKFTSGKHKRAGRSRVDIGVHRPYLPLSFSFSRTSSRLKAAAFCRCG
jgi:hypothetical protein